MDGDDARDAWKGRFLDAASAEPVPEKVLELADGAPLSAVWRNALGGLTYRAGGETVRFIKYGPRNTETSMADEAERMSWARRHIVVPRVLAHGADDTHEWLVTAAVPGLSAADPRWLSEPAVAVAAIGRGLRALHDSLPVEACPFTWSVADRVANAELRGIRVPERLTEAPPVDRLVVCHGDACAPNTLVSDDGAPTAHVDLGALGIADRWADIAVAAMSTEWNYGAGWRETLLDAYGVDVDAERMRFYQGLWNAT